MLNFPILLYNFAHFVVCNVILRYGEEKKEMLDYETNTAIKGQTWNDQACESLCICGNDQFCEFNMYVDTSSAQSTRRSKEISEILMLGRLSGRIVEWQIDKGILKVEERAVYQYAYELLLNQIINILLAVLIAVGFHAPIPVLLFLLSYIPLRSFCGGYHAGTNLGCTIVSSLTLCCVCMVSEHVREEWLSAWYPVSFLVSGYYIIRYAPVPDKNKPLDEAERIRYGKKSRILWGVEVFAGMLLYLTWRSYGMVIAISHIVISFMLCLGKMKNGRIQ